MSKYIGHESGLIGPVTMEKPKKSDYLEPYGETMVERPEYYDDLSEYENYLSSLPVIPCEGWVPEVGKEYVKGVDFELGAKYPDELDNKAPMFIAFPVAVPLPAANDGGDEFLTYVKNSRNAFASFVSDNECKPELKTAIDSLLICFDQMADRLQKQTTSINDNGDKLIERHRSIGDVVIKRIALTNDKILMEAYSRWLDVLNELIEGDRETLLKAFGIK